MPGHAKGEQEVQAGRAGRVAVGQGCAERLVEISAPLTAATPTRSLRGDKTSYMDDQNLGVEPLESYRRALSNQCVLKGRTPLFEVRSTISRISGVDSMRFYSAFDLRNP